MSNHNEPTCFFGLTSVRNGTRFIATLQLIFNTIMIIRTVVSIILLMIILEHFRDNMPSKDPAELTELIVMIPVLILSLCLMCPIVYLNYLLRKATSDRNVTVVKIWLVLNGILTILNLIIIVLLLLSKGTIYTEIINLGINVYVMSVVYRFYQQELEADGPQGFGIVHA